VTLVEVPRQAGQQRGPSLVLEMVEREPSRGGGHVIEVGAGEQLLEEPFLGAVSPTTRTDGTNREGNRRVNAARRARALPAMVANQ